MKQKNTDQLKRLIELIPVLNANPGITISELNKIAEYKSEGDLRNDLEKMIMYGVPPFSPADFIDLWIEDDKIYLHFTPCLDRPLELTSAEWSSIQQAISEEVKLTSGGEFSGDMLNEIQKKISDFPVAYDSAIPSGRRRSVIEEAIEENLQIEFTYRSIASRSPEIRRIDPWALISHRGASYVTGFCYLRNSPRNFNLERMENVEIIDVDREHDVPANLSEVLSDSPIFSKPSGFIVRIAYHPSVRNAVEYNFFPAETKEYDGGDEKFAGWIQSDCPVNESIWFRSMVRSFGSQMVILTPEHMRKSFLEELENADIF